MKSVPRREASGHLPLCGDVIIRGWFYWVGIDFEILRFNWIADRS